MNQTPQQLHIPVLLDDVLRLLDPKRGETYLDLTAGYGGHAGEVLARTENPDGMTLVDRDENAINELSNFAKAGATILRNDFLSAATELHEQEKKFDLILLDIGVSSPQLDRAERGFSFMRDGPLDMRMDQSRGLTAAQIVNRSSEKDLAKIIVKYGEESPKQAAKIAHAIRFHKPFRTTGQLAAAIKSTFPGYQKIHPATRTFQALRIATNDELSQLENTLKLIPDLLNPGGRVAVISFHSLEDRIVKSFFADHAKSGFESDMILLTKKPVDGAINDVTNPRARSAKLRAAAKIKK